MRPSRYGTWHSWVGVLGLWLAACSPPSDVAARTAAALPAAAAVDRLVEEAGGYAGKLGRVRGVISAGGDTRDPTEVEIVSLAGERRWARDSAVELYGVVLRGQVTLLADESDAAASLARWYAFRVPGAGIRLRARGAEVYVAVVAGEGETLRHGEDGTRAWSERPEPWQVQPIDRVERHRWANGRMSARLIFEQGLASLNLLYGAPNSQVPKHTHASSWE